MTGPAGDPRAHLPLVLTGDATLAAELHRLAAAAGVTLTVLEDPDVARPEWSRSPVVLVGADALTAVAAAVPPRRERVHVVARATVSDALLRAALAVGAESVLELPAADAWLVETLTDTADGALGRARVVGVVGGCGGAGATTFAAALAAAAASGGADGPGVRPVTLVDADPLGPGLERIVGLDDLEGARWRRLLESAGRLGSRSLLAALPQRDGLAVLGWGAGARVRLDPPVVREVLSAAQRGSALVVVDLPRHADAVTEELLHRCDDVVVLTTLTLAGVASSAQLTARIQPVVPRSHLVARGPAAALDPDDVADALGIPLAAAMADQRRLAEAVELGLGPLHARRGPLARAARATLARVAA